MKKKIVLLVIIILVLFFAFSYFFINPAKELNENDFEIISIKDGETGGFYSLTVEQENEIVELFNHTKFSKKFDILPGGGWSYWLEISIKGEETKIMISSWMEYKGKKYSPNIREEIEKILSEKESISENLVSTGIEDEKEVVNDKTEEEIIFDSLERDNENVSLSLDGIVVEGNYTQEMSLNDLIKEYSFTAIDLCETTDDQLYFIGRGIKEVIFRTDLMLKNPENLLIIKDQWERYIDEIKVIENSLVYGQTVIAVLNKDSYNIYDEDMKFIEEVKLLKKCRNLSRKLILDIGILMMP